MLVRGDRIDPSTLERRGHLALCPRDVVSITRDNLELIGVSSAPHGGIRREVVDCRIAEDSARTSS